MGIFRLVYISLLISVVLVSDNVPHTMRDMTITFYLFTIFDVVINKGWWPHQLTIIVWENIEVVVVFQVDISQSVVKPFSLGWYFGDKCSLNLVYIQDILKNKGDINMEQFLFFIFLKWNWKILRILLRQNIALPSVRPSPMWHLNFSQWFDGLNHTNHVYFLNAYLPGWPKHPPRHPVHLSLKKSISVTTTCKKCKKIVWKGNLQKYGLKSFKQFTNKWSGMMYCKKVNVLS